MRKYIEYLKLMWNSGAVKGKEMKESHKEKLKNLKKKGEDKE